MTRRLVKHYPNITSFFCSRQVPRAKKTSFLLVYLNTKCKYTECLWYLRFFIAMYFFKLLSQFFATFPHSQLFPPTSILLLPRDMSLEASIEARKAENKSKNGNKKKAQKAKKGKGLSGGGAKSVKGNTQSLKDRLSKGKGKTLGKKLNKGPSGGNSLATASLKVTIPGVRVGGGGGGGGMRRPNNGGSNRIVIKSAMRGGGSGGGRNGGRPNGNRNVVKRVGGGAVRIVRRG